MAFDDQGLDTTVAGLRCRDVLDALSEYLDNALPAERRSAVEQHLAGCERCARFGGDVSETLTALKRALQLPSPMSAERSARLRASLKRAQGVAPA